MNQPREICSLRVERLLGLIKHHTNRGALREPQAIFNESKLFETESESCFDSFEHTSAVQRQKAKALSYRNKHLYA